MIIFRGAIRPTDIERFDQLVSQREFHAYEELAANKKSGSGVHHTFPLLSPVTGKIHTTCSVFARFVRFW